MSENGRIDDKALTTSLKRILDRHNVKGARLSNMGERFPLLLTVKKVVVSRRLGDCRTLFLLVLIGGRF